MSHAKNAGWRAAEGSLVLFTDDDVVLDAGWIAAYVEFFGRLRDGPVVAGGPVHILLGTRAQLQPVWDAFGIVPLVEDPRAQDPGSGGALQERPPPTAAHDAFPAVGDGRFRGRPRHARGLDYEHSAYALLVDRHGRQRVGFPYEQITSEGLLADLQALKAEP